MAHFIESDNGFVNLDRVTTIGYGHATDKNNRYLFHGPDGKTLDVLTTAEARWFEEETGPLVPAAPGTTAVLVSVDSSQGRPTESEVFIDEAPIVAWRVHRNSASPVTVEEPASNQNLLVKYPDGRLIWAEMAEFSNLDQARQHFLTDAQNNWDRRQTKRATA